jgi:hypothetical protein
MKQLRAEGVRKLLNEQRKDLRQIQRLTRDDPELQRHFTSALDSLELAWIRVIDNEEEAEEERASA